MRRLTAVLLLLLTVSSASGASFLDHEGGVPYVWKEFPIEYSLDPGGLGALDGAAIVADALSVWSDVTTASVSFVRGPDMAEPVTASNIDTYVVFDDNGAPRSVSDLYTVMVIFDSDGSIIDELIGEGMSSYVLGLGSPGRLVEADHSIAQGLVIINGKSGNESQILATITHEIGHLLNMGHSQLNFEEGLDLAASNDDVVPTMFPLLSADPTSMLNLHLDDEFSLSYLYPNASYSDLGFISGRVIRRTGEGVRAVNVICRNSDDPRLTSVSFISDQTYEGDGNFLCGGLPGGDYWVEIEPIFLAINFYDPDPPYILWEFYSGDSESFDSAEERIEVDGELEEAVALVSVSPGSIEDGVDIILNEDGRLISGVEVTGYSRGTFPDMGYFITVPSGVREAVFEMEAEDPEVDLDLMGRCGGEFSLPIDSTAAPLISDSGEQQAEFASVSMEGSERVRLNSSSNPALRNCTYHILVPSFSPGRETEFSLKVTLRGGDPTLKVSKGKGVEAKSGTGTLMVMSRELRALEETFRLRGITVRETGEGDLSLIRRARLYIDVDGDGSVGSSDTLLGTAVVDEEGRMVFDFDEFIEDGESVTLLLVYDVDAAEAGWPLVALIPLIGFWFGVRRGIRATVPLVILCLWMGSCGVARHDIAPRIGGADGVRASGQSYGEDITIEVREEVNSVRDFFR